MPVAQFWLRMTALDAYFRGSVTVVQTESKPDLALTISLIESSTSKALTGTTGCAGTLSSETILGAALWPSGQWCRDDRRESRPMPQSQEWVRLSHHTSA